VLFVFGLFTFEGFADVFLGLEVVLALVVFGRSVLIS
jgi:hypothetical protein